MGEKYKYCMGNQGGLRSRYTWRLNGGWEIIRKGEWRLKATGD